MSLENAYRFPPLSFIDPESYLVFSPNANAFAEAIEIPFRLSSSIDELFLLDAQKRPVNMILFGHTRPDISRGVIATVDNDIGYSTIDVPSPGEANVANPRNEPRKIPGDFSTFRVEEFDVPLPQAWRQKEFDDRSWKVPESPSLFTRVPIVSASGPQTVYLHKGFELTAEEVATALIELNVAVRNGIAICVNGNLLTRANLPNGPLLHETVSIARSRRMTSSFLRTSSFFIPNTMLQVGENLLAAELHDGDRGIRRDTMAMIETLPGTNALKRQTLDLAEDLRVSEIMADPIGGSDFEFLELQNTGPDTLDSHHFSINGIRGLDRWQFNVRRRGLGRRWRLHQQRPCRRAPVRRVRKRVITTKTENSRR